MFRADEFEVIDSAASGRQNSTNETELSPLGIPYPDPRNITMKENSYSTV
jgi:hypothetical protein